VLVFLDPKASPQRVRKLVASHLKRNRSVAELISTSITLRGARVALKGFVGSTEKTVA
jgi:hypothetical protein